MTIGFRRYYSGTPARKLDGCPWGCCRKVAAHKYKTLSHRMSRRSARTQIQDTLDEELESAAMDEKEWNDLWTADNERQNFDDWRYGEWGDMWGERDDLIDDPRERGDCY